MPEGADTVTIRRVSSLEKVFPAAWDACAGSGNPFLSYAFLSAMERSGSASAESGWAPAHLLAEDSTGQLVACAPLYVKSHSFGEYVFDRQWADFWQRHGRSYYPKLQCAVPFSPVTGPRLLVRPDQVGRGLQVALAGAMSQLAEQAELSSAHITFSTEEEARALCEHGWLLRMGEQYHWNNNGYACFSDFLSELSSRKRKSIRKEREKANSLGVTIHSLTGSDIKPHHWDAFYRFYRDTVEKKWAYAYLNREFFTLLGESLADRVLLVMAEQDGLPVAGALNLIGADCLYGRNWGAEGDFKYLHFELCYYRAIDFAIEHGLARVEAGAQGEHKVSRGYMPVPTWSTHWIRELPFREPIATFLSQERALVFENIQALAETGPFRQCPES